MGNSRHANETARYGDEGLYRTRSRVGLHVRELRLARGISQEELAFRASVSRSCVVNIEGHHIGLKCESLRRVIAALNLSVREFFEDERFAQIDSTHIIHRNWRLQALGNRNITDENLIPHYRVNVR